MSRARQRLQRPDQVELGADRRADENVPPVLVHEDGTVTEGTYPQAKHIEGGYSVLELPSRQAALEWAAKIAGACRTC